MNAPVAAGHRKSDAVPNAATPGCLPFRPALACRARRQRNVIKPELPRIIEFQRAAKPHPPCSCKAVHARATDTEARGNFVPAHRDAVFRHPPPNPSEPAHQAALSTGKIAHRLGHNATCQVARKRPIDRFQLQPIDCTDRKPFAQKVVAAQRVARRPSPTTSTLRPLYASGYGRVRCSGFQRRSSPYSSTPHGSPAHPSAPTFRLRDVDRVLLLENARFHAVVADPMSRPGTHRVVEHDQRQRPSGSPADAVRGFEIFFPSGQPVSRAPSGFGFTAPFCRACLCCTSLCCARGSTCSSRLRPAPAAGSCADRSVQSHPVGAGVLRVRTALPGCSDRADAGAQAARSRSLSAGEIPGVPHRAALVLRRQPAHQDRKLRRLVIEQRRSPSRARSRSLGSDERPCREKSSASLRPSRWPGPRSGGACPPGV